MCYCKQAEFTPNPTCQEYGCQYPNTQPQFKFGDKVWYIFRKEWVLITVVRQGTILVTHNNGLQTWTHAEALSLTKPKRKVTRSVKGWKHQKTSAFYEDTDIGPKYKKYYPIPATLTWEEEVDE